MAEDVGPTNPGVDPVTVNPATGRAPVDYTSGLAQGQTAETEEVAAEAELPGQQYQIQAVLNDAYTAKVFDGANALDPSVLIARPFQHRVTPFDGQTVNGKTYTYITLNERTVESDAEFIHQFLEPPFNLGFDLIYAMEVPNTSVTGVTLVEVGSTRNWITTSKILRYKIVSVGNDHLVCNLLNRDGTIEDVAVTFQILKPRDLRHLPAVVGNGRTYAYTGPQARTASSVPLGPFSGQPDEDHIIIPAYEVGDVVHARRVQGGAEIPVDALTDAQDLYVEVDSGRAWAVTG